MKRADPLKPLSREHHEALVLARRVCSVEPHSDAAQRQCEEVLVRWREQFEPHFEAEERALLPALCAAGETAAAARALAEHDALRRLAARLRAGDAHALAPWGEAMQAHVRFEERELFPLAEHVLDLDALAEPLARQPTSPFSSR
jgi:hemerythrin-like domain-containing protein